MLIPERVRVAAAGRVALACIVWAVFASGIAVAQHTAEVPALPETITKESVRDLLSRLSDAQVRNLLIDQLDRTAASASKAPAAAGASDRAGMAGMVDQHAGEMRSRYDTLNAAFVGLPATFANLVTRLREPDGRPALVAVFGYVVAMLATGFVAEWLYRYALRRYRQRPAAGDGDDVFGARVPGRHGARARHRRAAGIRHRGDPVLLLVVARLRPAADPRAADSVHRVGAARRRTVRAVPAGPQRRACAPAAFRRPGGWPPARLYPRTGRTLRPEHCSAVAAERRGERSRKPST